MKRIPTCGFQMGVARPITVHGVVVVYDFASIVLANQKRKDPIWNFQIGSF